MGNMRASFVVTADASGIVGELSRADQALKRTEIAAGQLGSALRSTRSADAINASVGVGRAATSAEHSAAVFSRALAEQEVRFKSLRAAIDPAWRAEQQFTATQAELNRALKSGTTDARTHADMMRRLEAQYETARKAALALDGAQGGMWRGAGGMRGQIQNASFQVADLATQIGAGTAASVAFGQQLPQLLGGMGMMGAVAGAVVAIGVPLASSLLGGASAAKEAEEGMKRLDTALQRVSDSFALVNDQSLETKFGSMTGSVREMSRAMLELDRAAELKALGDTLGKTVDQKIGWQATPWLYRPLWTPGDEQATMLERANYAKLTGGKGLSYDDFQTRRQELDLSARTGQVEQVAAKVEQLIKDMADGGPVTSMNAELAETLRVLGEMAIKTAEIEAQYNGTAAAAAAYADVLGRATARQDELKQLTDVRADAERRLGDALAARDAAAASSARSVIAEADRQIAATTDAKARVDALGTSFAEIERVASVVSFDKDGRMRAAIDKTKTTLAEARAKVGELNDAQLSTLESAFARLTKAVRDMASATTGIGGAFGGLDVSGYADAMGASRAVIQKYESWAPVAKWDENANRGGWGSSTVTLADGSQRKLAAGETVDKAGADRDLDRRIRGYFDEQQRVAGAAWARFSPAQVAALSSIQHNYGSLPQRIQPALQTGDAQVIAQAIAGLAMDYTKSERAAGKAGRPMNYARRMGEAAAFGDAAGVREADDAALAARAEQERKDKDAAREAERLGKQRADADKRTRDGITAELDRLTPSYDRARAAAERWRDDALAALDKTKPGYEAFAADVERVFQEQLRKAYDDDLKRRDEWAAGVEAGFAKLHDDARSWADTSAALVEGWAKGGEDAFTRFVTTGKASMTELVDFTLEQLARMAWQQNIQPGLEGVLKWAANGLGTMLGGGDALSSALSAAGAPVAIRTAHTGGTGVMRSYGAGSRQRHDEQLTMIRRGEEVFTPRMLENGAAMVDLLTGMAGRGGEQQVLDTRPVIQIVNNSSARAEAEVRETRDERGGRQYQLVLSDAVAGALTAPGGRAGQTLRTQFGVEKRGPRR